MREVYIIQILVAVLSGIHFATMLGMVYHDIGLQIMLATTLFFAPAYIAISGYVVLRLIWRKI